MSVSTTSNIGVTLPPASLPVLTSPITTSNSGAAAAAPVDTVMLSSAAQQSLATGAAAPSADFSQPDIVTQAIAALNDTSGNTSVTDQIQAYTSLANFVEGPQYVAWMATAVPGVSGPPPENDFTAAKGNAIVALIDSPFAQHAQQVLNTVNVQYSGDGDRADVAAAVVNTHLTSFNALSSTDQQIYLGLTSLGAQLEGRQDDLATADDYRANQQAQASVYQALQAAISNPAYASTIAQARIPVAGQVFTGGVAGDVQALTKAATAAGDQATLSLIDLYNSSDRNTTAWTQQAQAYFAQNGTPPALDSATSASLLGPVSHLACDDNPTPDGATLTAALSASWNTTGNASVTDQTNALATIWEYFASNKDNSPALMAIGTLGESPFQQQANAAAQNFFFSSGVQAAWGNDDPSTTPSELALLNKLPLQQQQLIFAGSSWNLPNQGFVDGQNIYYATLDDWKAALGKQDAANRAAWQNQQSSAATSASSASVAAAVSAAASTPPAPAAVTAATSQAAQALANLTAKTPVYSNAEVALTVLQNASKAAAEAKTANNTHSSNTANASAGASTAKTPGTAHPTPRDIGKAVSVLA